MSGLDDRHEYRMEITEKRITGYLALSIKMNFGKNRKK
jgi:hypothetical protein